MLRTVFGFRKTQHVNMENVRSEFKIMSVNQMCVYHTLVEANNVVKNSSSEKIKMKWDTKLETKYSLRSTDEKLLKVPDKPTSKCTGFSYSGAKLYNLLPRNIRDTSNSTTFKVLIKELI